MKKYTKKIMAMVTVAATMVTGTAIPVMADDAPTIRLITWLTPSNPAQKPSYDAIESFADDHADEFTLEHENIVGDELKAKIKTDIAGDTVPDIFIYWGSGGNSTMLLDADVIIPFDDVLLNDSSGNKSLLTNSDASRYSSNGTLTTITTSLQYGVWLCNKALFEEYGLELLHLQWDQRVEIQHMNS